MQSGFYTAASGMLSRNKSLEVIANNIANADTAGYKKDTVLSTTFGQHLAKQGEGTEVFGNQPDMSFTSFVQGTVIDTGRLLDFCIQGNGFFTVEMPDGTEALTRNGQFAVDGNGYLIDGKGNRVMGQNGAIMLNSADFTVDEKGNVYSDDVYFDTLAITVPIDLDALVKIDEGLFTSTGGNSLFEGSIRQGAVEGSNIDMVKEMADMMASSRGFQSCSQLIKMFDQIEQKSANELGKL